jgi:hypothetical protein
LQAGVELPYAAIRSNIADAVNVLLHIERRQGRRYVADLLEVKSYDPANDKFQFITIYQS